VGFKLLISQNCYYFEIKIEIFTFSRKIKTWQVENKISFTQITLAEAALQLCDTKKDR
jgi:hypothetical protein